MPTLVEQIRLEEFKDRVRSIVIGYFNNDYGINECVQAYEQYYDSLSNNEKAFVINFYKSKRGALRTIITTMKWELDALGEAT